MGPRPRPTLFITISEFQYELEEEQFENHLNIKNKILAELDAFKKDEKICKNGSKFRGRMKRYCTERRTGSTYRTIEVLTVKNFYYINMETKKLYQY